MEDIGASFHRAEGISQIMKPELLMEKHISYVQEGIKRDV